MRLVETNFTVLWDVALQPITLYYNIIHYYNVTSLLQYCDYLFRANWVRGFRMCRRARQRHPLSLAIGFAYIVAGEGV